MTAPSPIARCLPTVVISNEGVTSLLEGLDPSKAYSPDNIPTRFIKETAVDSIIDLFISGISEAG